MAMRCQTNMRRSVQLRSSIAGKARQTGDSFAQVTQCPPSTNEEAKGALKWMTSPAIQGWTVGSIRNRKLVLEYLL